jgi:hypothetical protein
MFFIILLVVLAFAVLSDVYDVAQTERGLKNTPYVEGFTWLVGQRPTAIALYLRDSLLLLLVTTPSVLASFVNKPAAYGLLVGPLVYGVKHIRGGREWARLIAGGALPDPTIPKTAWQKFLEG